MTELKHGEIYRIKHPLTGKWIEAEFYKAKPNSGAFDLFIIDEGSIRSEYVREWK